MCVTNFFYASFVIKLEDPTDLPDAILAVVGKTFTFGISVEKEHVLYGSEIYKVGKIFKDRMVALTDSVKLENSQTDGVLTLTSGEEVWLYVLFYLRFTSYTWERCIINYESY